MTDVTRDPAHGRSHPPAHDEAERAEPRERTVERVLERTDQPRHGRAQGATADADPTSRRGFHRLLTARAGLGFLAGFVLGVAITLIANATAPQALGDPGTGGLIGACLVIGAALGLVGVVMTAFVVLGREDGRVERRIEEDLGDQPPPGKGLDPRHDVSP